MSHKLAIVAVTFVLQISPLWAAAAQGENRFDPVRLVSVAETMYPVDTAASGTVILQVTVEKMGRIGNIQVVRGIPKLTAEAERSVRRWKFAPARLNGHQVAAPVVVAFTFSLSLPWSSGVAPVKPRAKALTSFEPIKITSTSEANNPVPDIALAAVTLQVSVDPTGSLGKIEVIDGITPLAAEAERSVRQWKCLPARFEGSALTSSMVTTFLFSDVPLGRCSRF